MSELKAFIGHSFTENDEDVVRQFIEFFDHVKDMGFGFSWDHAEPAEPKVLSGKVLALMEGKNLFIAICTSKELAITQDKLKKTWLDKNIVKAEYDEFAAKTSDWIIQEIGIAMGKGMDVIVLLEEGLRKPGGLQGDLEYIGFNRNEPSKSFIKILEMLKALTPKKAIGPIAQMEVEEKKEKKILEETADERLEPSEDWKRKDYEYALFRSIGRNNKDSEEKIIKAYIKSSEGQNNTDIDEFKALQYHFRQWQGKGIYVEELKALSDKRAESSLISLYLGQAYEKYADFEKAAIQYEKAATSAKSNKEMLAYFCNSAEARSNMRESNASDWLLNKARGLIATVEGGEFKILSSLKNIAEIQDKSDQYLAYCESILDIAPDDHDLRFSLAYKYSGLNNSELSLFHYLMIPGANQSSTIWNNIGVAYSRLEIQGKAVEAYRKSEAMGGTLAMSNLAHKFLEEGFLKEAAEICDRAVKTENYDKTVGSAINKIKKTEEEENEKHKKSLKDIEKRRKFYIDFGKACIKQPPEEHERIWIGPECELSINIKDRSLIATGSYEKKEIPKVGLGAIYMGYPIKREVKIIKVSIRYEGVITGHGIEFKMYVDEYGVEKKAVLGISLLEGGPKKEGLMTISDDMTIIKVYEKGTKETEKFYELHKK